MADLDRLRAALDALIRWTTREQPYLRLYPATVRAQAADGTLDLEPDDAAIRGTGLSGVPIRHGIPGVTVEISAGQRIMLGFEAGDPRRPYAALWRTSGTAKLGSLLVVQHGSTLALVAVTWFQAGTVGDTAAAVALAAALAGGNIAHLVPLTAGIVAA